MRIQTYLRYTYTDSGKCTYIFISIKRHKHQKHIQSFLVTTHTNVLRHKHIYTKPFLETNRHNNSSTQTQATNRFSDTNKNFKKSLNKQTQLTYDTHKHNHSSIQTQTTKRFLNTYLKRKYNIHRQTQTDTTNLQH